LALITLLSLALPERAAADNGELRLGLDLYGGLPGHAGVAAQAELGVGDWLALFVRPGCAAPLPEADALQLQLRGGLLAMLDIFTWVPYAALGGGLSVERGESEPALLLQLGMRRFVTLRWAIDISASGQWTPNGWSGSAAVGLRWQPLL